MIEPDPTTSPTAPVVIVSATRSGSTLLQRVLNSSGDVTIWGEHFGLLTPLMRSLRIAQRNSKALATGNEFAAQAGDPESAGKIANPHVNPFDATDYEDQLREFIRVLFGDRAPSGRWGFKEVRYRRMELEALLELFPDARIIVLARQPEDQIFSMARAPWRQAFDLVDPAERTTCREQLEKFAAAWTDQYTALRRFCDDHPDATYRLTFDRLRAETFPADELAGFLGIRFDAGRLDEVFSARLGSSDQTARWSGADKKMLREMIDELTWSPRHTEVREYFLPTSGPT